MFPMCSSRVCHPSTTLFFIPYGLPKVLPFSPIYLGHRIPHVFTLKLQFWGVFKGFSSFFCDVPIKMANCHQIKKYKKYKKKNLGKHPIL